MKKNKLILLVFFAFCFIGAKAQTYTANDVIGYWFNDTKTAKIKIYSEDSKFFGKIVWMKHPLDEESGKPKLDKLNPDDKLKSRPKMNLVIMANFVFDDDDEWESGTIYDPDSGKTYKCYMKFENIEKNQLNIRGYIGKAWMGLGKTSAWTKTTL